MLFQADWDALACEDRVDGESGLLGIHEDTHLRELQFAGASISGHAHFSECFRYPA